MVKYSHTDIHLGVGCRYKDYSNLLLDHLSSHKERCSAWVTHRLSDETSMKYVSVQKDILKMSKSTPAKAPPSLPSKHQSLSTIPNMCSPAAPRAFMTNTKSQQLLSLFPQPETQMWVQNWRKNLRKFAETVEFRRKTYWITPRMVSLPLSGFLFLSPCVTDWRKAREGNTCNRFPLPFHRKSLGFSLGNKVLVVDCALFCLYRSLSPSPREPWSPVLQVGDVWEGVGWPRWHCPPWPVALDAQSLQ